MELKEFIEIIKKDWKLITILTVLITAISAVITSLIPPKYISSIDVYVSRKATAESDQYYTYDGYYSTQSSMQYASTVSGIFQSLQTVREAAFQLDQNESYIKSEKEPGELHSDVDYLRGISKKITVEDVAPQVITVSFKHQDVTKSEMWISLLGDVVKEKITALNKDSDGNFRVDISPEPLVEESYPSLWINIIVSSMLGILLGVLWAFLKNYLRKSK